MTMMEKVKKPSIETMSTTNLLGILLQNKFKQTESMIDDWSALTSFVKANTGRIKKYMATLPDRFMEQKYKGILYLKDYYYDL